MNDKYKEIYNWAAELCHEGTAWEWEKRYAELIVQECLNQMSDYLDKQRVLKHFGMEK